jgi:hypothetical protein
MYAESSLSGLPRRYAPRNDRINQRLPKTLGIINIEVPFGLTDAFAQDAQKQAQ